MAAKKQEQYGNSSISMLKGEDRVRKRPAVIFGSDDLEGCKHAVFEILSNAIDEAREGHGDTIIVTKMGDGHCKYTPQEALDEIAKVRAEEAAEKAAKAKEAAAANA